MPFDVGMLDSAASFFIDAFLAPPWSEDWSLEDARRRLADIASTPGWLGVAAVEGDALIGAALGNLEQVIGGVELNVRELFVGPERQRSGCRPRAVGGAAWGSGRARSGEGISSDCR